MSYQTPFQHLRVGQVANVYGVSIPTIWRWLKENRIPKPTKICGSTRWPLNTHKILILFNKLVVEKVEHTTTT